MHHSVGFRAQPFWGYEIAAQSVAQVFCFTHVYNSAVGITKTVYTGVRWDIAGGWAIALGICHERSSRCSTEK